MRTLMCVVLGCVCIVASSQAPLQLDTNFRTDVQTWYVSSVAPLASGEVLLSGMIKFPGDLSFRLLAKVDGNGTQVPSFPYTYGGGKLTPWNGQFYVASSQTVRRLTSDGLVDPAFIHMNLGSYFSSLQGGDYHVYPDGRVLMSGVHQLSDTVRGFEGLYSLIWFSNTGYLDTTRTHRYCNGSIDYFRQLPDGKFICSGALTSYEGQPVNRVFRVQADGALDTTFTVPISWGKAFAFHPLADGRVYIGGYFGIIGSADTVQVLRLLPDGSLDPTFNNALDFGLGDLSGTLVIGGITELDAGHLVIAGGFESIEGDQRQGICLVDTNGVLLNDHFTGPGCGDYVYQNFTHGSIRGIVPAPDGCYYIYGAYHGYGDAFVTDSTQRMVSRLYGLDVGVAEPVTTLPIKVQPNPSTGAFTLSYPPQAGAGELEIRDLSGRLILRDRIPQWSQVHAVELRGQAAGLYQCTLHWRDRAAHIRLVLE